MKGHKKYIVFFVALMLLMLSLVVVATYQAEHHEVGASSSADFLDTATTTLAPTQIPEPPSVCGREGIKCSRSLRMRQQAEEH